MRPFASVAVTRKSYVPAFVNVPSAFLAALLPFGEIVTGAGPEVSVQV